MPTQGRYILNTQLRFKGDNLVSNFDRINKYRGKRVYNCVTTGFGFVVTPELIEMLEERAAMEIDKPFSTDELPRIEYQKANRQGVPLDEYGLTSFNEFMKKFL